VNFRTRFAPSPTGLLHLGHLFSAHVAFTLAKKNSGDFLLRIDDIDTSRSKKKWEDKIYEDLEWLGLTWSSSPLKQTELIQEYHEALKKLKQMGVLYPCSCTRSDILTALSAPHESTSTPRQFNKVYPGTCRGRPMSTALNSDAIRLDMQQAQNLINSELFYQETGVTPGLKKINTNSLSTVFGDVVLRRKGKNEIAYHLAVVVDDAFQKITHVVRGSDLQEATKVHVMLQNLLNIETPIYHHHRLVLDENGKRLAKRNDARSISSFKKRGLDPTDVFKLAGINEL